MSTGEIPQSEIRGQRRDVGFENLQQVNPEAEEKIRLGVAEVQYFLENPKGGFMVLEADKANPDFWEGVSRALKNRAPEVGDVSGVTDQIDRAIRGLRVGETVDIRQLKSSIEARFQQ